MYLLDLVDNFKSNPKRYWTFLKCFSKKGSLHPVLRDGEVLVSDDLGRASVLNRVFASKFSDPAITVYPPVVQHHLPVLNSITVSPDRVCAILKSTRATKACGPDGISARIVQECACELSVPLAKLCNMSLRQGIFPSKWKQANIVPLHKKAIRGTLKIIGRCHFCHFLVKLSKKLFTTNFCDMLPQSFPRLNMVSSPADPASPT